LLCFLSFLGRIQIFEYPILTNNYQPFGTVFVEQAHSVTKDGQMVRDTNGRLSCFALFWVIIAFPRFLWPMR
jgi:hypothetical protein